MLSVGSLLLRRNNLISNKNNLELYIVLDVDTRSTYCQDYPYVISLKLDYKNNIQVSTCNLTYAFVEIC